MTQVKTIENKFTDLILLILSINFTLDQVIGMAYSSKYISLTITEPTSVGIRNENGWASF